MLVTAADIPNFVTGGFGEDRDSGTEPQSARNREREYAEGVPIAITGPGSLRKNSMSYGTSLSRTGNEVEGSNASGSPRSTSLSGSFKTHTIQAAPSNSSHEVHSPVKITRMLSPPCLQDTPAQPAGTTLAAPGNLSAIRSTSLHHSEPSDITVVIQK